MTINPIAESRVPVRLGDRDLVMIFNANTMVAFEQATGKFFMDVVTGLYEIMFPKGHEDAKGAPVPVRVKGLDIVRQISMTDLRALLWSSFHEYDAQDNPVWPMTIAQVGRQLNFQNVIPVFIKFLTGVSDNSPTKEELGESQAEESAKPTPVLVDASANKKAAGPGGEDGIRLPADALA